MAYVVLKYFNRYTLLDKCLLKPGLEIEIFSFGFDIDLFFNQHSKSVLSPGLNRIKY